jgi:hypothetical protein
MRMAPTDPPPEKEFNPRSGCLGRLTILVLIGTFVVAAWFLLGVVRIFLDGGVGP